MYIPTYKLSEVRQRVEAYNKKWNTNVVLEEEETTIRERTVDGVKESFEATYVSLSAPQIKTAKEGVELLEIVSVDNGVEHVAFKGTDKHIPYRKDECDHCHSKRARKLYYIISYNGEIRQIGSGCIKEYLGESIYSVFSGFYKLISDINNEEERLAPVPRGNLMFSTKDVIGVLYKVTNGLTKWESASYGEGTGNRVRDILMTTSGDFSSIFPLSEEDRMDLISHLLYNRDNGGSFGYNVYSACLDSSNNLREYIPYQAIGTFCWGIYEYFRSKNEGALEKEKTHLSPICRDVGLKVSFEADVTLLRKGTSAWDKDYYEYLASDGEHCAAWRTSKKIENGRYRITGKVKGLWRRGGNFCSFFGGRVSVEPINQ